MSTQEETRKLIAKERQHQEYWKENMLSPTIEEVKTHTTEQARELIARERQHGIKLRLRSLSE